MIESLSRDVASYLRSFGLGCIFITAKGAIGTGSDLARGEHPVAAWWVQSRRSAEEVLTAIGEHPPSSIEDATRAVAAAADRLGIQLSSHEAVMVRTKAAVVALDNKLEAAQQGGALKFLNSEYRRRRLEAQRSGRRFMSYSEAQRRLKSALAGAAAGHAMPELISAVFEPPVAE